MLQADRAAGVAASDKITGGAAALPSSGVPASPGLHAYEPLPEECALFARKFAPDAGKANSFFNACWGVGLRPRCLDAAARAEGTYTHSVNAAAGVHGHAAGGGAAGGLSPALLIAPFVVSSVLLFALLLGWQHWRRRQHCAHGCSHAQGHALRAHSTLTAGDRTDSQAMRRNGAASMRSRVHAVCDEALLSSNGRDSLDRELSRKVST